MSFLPHFTFDELKCKGTGIVLLAVGFADKLEELRTQFNKPMIVNSCCRTPEYNKQIGGHPKSMHLTDNPYWNTGGACAIDIHCSSDGYKIRLRQLALDLGWSVGVYDTFLHLDRRSDYTNLQQTIFNG